MTLCRPSSNGIAILLALMTSMAAAVAEEHEPGRRPPVDGIRQVLPLNREWEFSGSNIALQEVRETVDLPHTWNDRDAQAGYEFFRGKGTYRKTLFIDESYRNKRVFVHFGAAGIVADVSVNGEHLGQHRGGYSAFAYELTPYLRTGEENILTVVADNSPVDDVMPLAGDFDQFGGMHRPAKLIVTGRANITPLDYASPGVYLSQRSVNQDRAEVDVRAEVSNGHEEAKTLGLRVTVVDAEGAIVTRADGQATISAAAAAPIETSLTVDRPHLWHGVEDPYLYRATIELLDGDQVIDRVEQPLGLRSFRLDPAEGFFLNGKSFPLHGVARHNERKDRGSALTEADHEEDLALILEMGANTVRLAHYQHPQYFQELCDRAGLVTWAEIPFVGLPAFLATTYHDNAVFHANGRQQLTELIRQNYNHPSIFFWGLFNEQPNPEDNSPLAFMKELQELAKLEDPTRLTTAASMIEAADPIHDVPDTIAWNRYFGWYYGEPDGLATFLDGVHAEWPQRAIGISEYGAGASIRQHQEEVEKPNPFGLWHPEGWQARFHKESWRVLSERPYVWGTYVWAMFDFTSSLRREGDAYGINDKGLVSHDRKTRKDAFYFYKATWTDDPVLHIIGRRHLERGADAIDVTVYSNVGDVALDVNAQRVGPGRKDGVAYIWNDVTLKEGNNVVAASAGGESDTVVWMQSGPGMRIARIAITVMSHLVGILSGGAVWILVLVVLARRAAPSTGRRFLWKALAWLSLVIYLLFWAGILYLPSQGMNPFDN